MRVESLLVVVLCRSVPSQDLESVFAIHSFIHARNITPLWEFKAIAPNFKKELKMAIFLFLTRFIPVIE